jgi:PAS domain S-box-containing protein
MEIIQKGERVENFETVIRRKEGEKRVISWQSNNLINERGEIVGSIALGADITERKNAEEMLRISEKFLNSVIENTPNPMWISDENGTVIRMNQALRDLLKISDNEIVSKYNVLKDTQVKEQGLLPLVTSVFEKGETVEFEIDYITTREEQVQLSREVHKILDIIISPVKDSQGKVINAIAQHKDITERKRAETALRESEERFRQFAENIDQVFWLTDWDAKKLLYVNPAYERLYGRSCQSAYEDRKSWQDVIHPEDRTRISESFARSADLGQYAEAEYRIVRDDGTVRWVLDRSYPIRDKYGRIYRFASVADDITERKKAEDALRESEEKYRAIIEAVGRAGEGIIIIQDNEQGEAAFVFVNDQFCQMSDYSQEELMGRSPWDFVPHEVSVRLKDWYKRRHTGESLPGHYEAAGIRKDGAIVPLDLSIVTMPWQGNIATVLYLRDITERKLAEEALRAERDRLETMTQNMGAGMAIISRDYRTVWANKVLKQIFGEVEGKSCYSTYNQNPDICPECGVRKVFETGIAQVIHEQVGKDKEGNTIWSQIIATPIRDKEGNITAALEIVVPITERKRAEEALRETTQTLEALIQASPLPIFVLDRERIVKTWNPAAERTFGWGAQEIIGHQYPAIPKEKMDEADALFLRALESGLTGVETHRQRKDGLLIDVSISAAPLQDSRGNINGIMAVIADITERKKLQEQLIQTEKLAAVGTLAYGIAHEFNNILAGMLANAELGLVTDEPRQIKECFEIIADNSHRAASITNNLLAFARQKEARKELIDITEPLRSVLAVTRRDLEKLSLEIVEKFKPVPKIYCDAGQPYRSKQIEIISG